MKRDFKHLGTLDNRRSKSSSAWLWLIGGIALGLFITFLNYLHEQTPTVEQPVVSFDKPLPPPEKPKEQAASAAIGADTPAPAPNNDFDFYTVLPKMEMPVPEATPAPTRPAPKASEKQPETVANANEALSTGKETAKAEKSEPKAKPKTQEKPKEKVAKTEKAPKPAKTAPPSKPAVVAKTERQKIGAYLLQVGSFRNMREADGMKARLALLGVEARIQTVKLNSRDTLHRVRVGPYADYDKVSRLQSRLKMSNIKTVVVKART